MALDPQKCAEILAIAGRLVPSGTAARGDVPATGTCVASSDDAYCWKFENDNPNAFYDFFLISSCIRNPGTGATLQALDVIPLDNGDYVITTTHTERLEIERNTYVRSMKASHGSFGAVSISRLKVKEFYDGLNRTLFKIASDFYRLDADNQLLEYRSGAHLAFPPLPGGDRFSLSSSPAQTLAVDGDGLLEYRLRQADPINTVATDGISFAVSTPIAVDATGRVTDYELVCGEPYEVGTSGDPMVAGSPGRPPGQFLIRLGVQGGSPSYASTSMYRTDRHGVPQLIFEKLATGFAYEEVRQHVIVKRRSSWFRKTTKVTTLREVFRMAGEKAREVYYPQPREDG